jgi:hypothetical protein
MEMFGRTAQTSDVSEDRHVSKQESWFWKLSGMKSRDVAVRAKFFLRLR